MTSSYARQADRVFHNAGIGHTPASPTALKKLHGIGFKHVRELLQHVDRRGMLFTFEHSDIIPVDVRTVGKLLLRQAFSLPQPAQISGDGLAQSHARDVAGSLIYCHLVY